MNPLKLLVSMAAGLATFAGIPNTPSDSQGKPVYFKDEPPGYLRGHGNPASNHYGGNASSVRGIQRRKFGNEARRNREPWAMVSAKPVGKRNGFTVLDNGTFIRAL
jgi:hypothetical protein